MDCICFYMCHVTAIELTYHDYHRQETVEVFWQSNLHQRDVCVNVVILCKQTGIQDELLHT